MEFLGITGVEDKLQEVLLKIKIILGCLLNIRKC